MADSAQTKEMPPGANRRHPNAKHGDESGASSLANPSDIPEEALREAYELGKADGRQQGFTAGYVRAWAEALQDFATEAHRIETAARRFHELDAEDAHNKALARSAAEHIDVRRARAGVGA